MTNTLLIGVVCVTSLLVVGLPSSLAVRDDLERGNFAEEKLAEASKTAPKGYSVMVANINQEIEPKLFDVHSYKEFNENGKRFGVWIFRCGEFENNGNSVGRRNWAWSGPDYHVDKDGDEVEFYHKECPNSKYRGRSFFCEMCKVCCKLFDKR